MPTKGKRYRPTAFRNASPLLDAINVEIVRQLSADPRMAMKELARRVGMSGPSVTERVQRLEEGGVIKGTRLEIDQRALGLHLTAYVRVRPMPGQLPKLAQLARATPEVVECHLVTGEDCFIMKIFVGAVEDLGAVLDKFLQHGTTTTSIVQASPVPLRGPPLPTPTSGRRPDSDRRTP